MQEIEKLSQFIDNQVVDNELAQQYWDKIKQTMLSEVRDKMKHLVAEQQKVLVNNQKIMQTKNLKEQSLSIQIQKLDLENSMLKEQNERLEKMIIMQNELNQFKKETGQNVTFDSLFK